MVGNIESSSELFGKMLGNRWKHVGNTWEQFESFVCHSFDKLDFSLRHFVEPPRCTVSRDKKNLDVWLAGGRFLGLA